MPEQDKHKGTRRGLIRKAMQGVFVGAAAGLLAVSAGFLEISEHLELMALDLRFKLRPSIEMLSDVGYIEFDDSSLERFGKWPWSRSRQVALVNTLGLYGARAAGYDVFFIERENTVFHSGEVRQYFSGQRGPGADYQTLLQESFRDYDREFEKGLRKAGNIYLAYFSEDPKTSEKTLAGILKETKENIKSYPSEKRESVGELEKTFLKANKTAEQNAYKIVKIDAPLPEFIRAAKGIGFAQPGYNKDAIVRNYIFYRYYDGKLLYPITIKILSDIMDFKISDIEAVPDRHLIIKNAKDYKTGQRTDLKIPIDDHFQTLLNWAGPFNRTFLRVPFEYINYHYSYNLAKEIARKSMSSKTDINEKAFIRAAARIRTRLETEGIAIGSEADKVAKEVAGAQLISLGLDKNMSEKQMTAVLGKHMEEKQAQRIFDSVFTGHSASKAIKNNPELSPQEFFATGQWRGDRQLREEAFKNIRFFALAGKLEEIRPFYFPPLIQVKRNDKDIMLSPLDLYGKIFMIGLTGTQTIDLKPMPFDESAPMVAYHVNALNMVLTKNFLSFPPQYFKYAATLGLAVVIGLLGGVFSIPVFSGITAAITACYLFVTYHIWASKGVWLEWAVPLTAILLAFLASAVIQLIREFREKKKVRGIFSTMVSPAVLKVMEENPDKFSLTGERKPATMLFSKIDGIGDVIKTIAPDELTQLLSIYLTPNSEIIMEYDGYIDKYEGHVIMADFGVPLDDPDNPWKCAFSTVEQRLDIEAFKYFVNVRYGLNVGVSMGFNYGYVSAGNMGSERKFQYTVMGDPVNVSARFMAANYIYNSPYSITGEESVAALEDFVHLRLLDKLLLKGKTRPTEISDILGWKSDAYLKMRGKSPVPEFLRTVWAKCPPEKIFGYHALWEARQKRLNSGLAKDIAKFFEDSLPAATDMMTAEWKGYLLACVKRIGNIELNAKILLGHTAERRPVSGSVEVLGQWHERIADISGKAADALKKGTDSGDNLAGLVRECGIVQARIGLFMNRLGLDAAGAQEERVLEVFGRIKAFIPSVSSIQNSDEAFGKIETELNGFRKSYSASADSFFNAVKTRKEEYHELMAVIGAPDEETLKASAFFDKGLRLYWERRWDPALEEFKKAATAGADGGPARSFIERTETYKNSPPGDKWQGEFVQTKK
ncbi:MAG: adenylate/guanylate cyclase domain-containing protein [Nitrospirae bacterium]|nr:MAG: adenylate/guanylate cyclase domain-containing protein [Nitrospirota bacterium]